jgi:hypothetical protein
MKLMEGDLTCTGTFGSLQRQGQLGDECLELLEIELHGKFNYHSTLRPEIPLI